MKTQIIQKQFKRKESKYIVEKSVFQNFIQDLSQYMVADDYAQSTITNIYFDNEHFDMIQDAIAKKNGREKVRMRIYDTTPSATSQAFLEIKKKENKIGYKYRLTSNPVSVSNYIENGIVDATIQDQKVTSELNQLRQRYGQIQPKMYIYYERKSFKGIHNPEVRLTVDQNLIYRDTAVDATKGCFGNPLLPSNQLIMEIKVSNQKPAWLEELLQRHQIEKGSFSKYGTAYRLSKEAKGELNYAVI